MTKKFNLHDWSPFGGEKKIGHLLTQTDEVIGHDDLLFMMRAFEERISELELVYLNYSSKKDEDKKEISDPYEDIYAKLYRKKKEEENSSSVSLIQKKFKEFNKETDFSFPGTSQDNPCDEKDEENINWCLNLYGQCWIRTKNMEKQND